MGSPKTTGKRNTTAIVAIAVTCGALLTLFLSRHTFSPPFNAKPHEGLGEILAGEALKLVGPGGRFILIARDSDAIENPAADAQLRSFAQVARKGGATLARTNLIKVDPLRLVTVPVKEFSTILGNATEHDVVVSFLGLPEIPGAPPAKPGAKPARVVAVCSGTMPERVNLKALFERNVLAAAIISRQVVASPAPAVDTPQAWFDHLFHVITPTNLADLPPRAAASR